MGTSIILYVTMRLWTLILKQKLLVNNLNTSTFTEKWRKSNFLIKKGVKKNFVSPQIIYGKYSFYGNFNI